MTAYTSHNRLFEKVTPTISRLKTDMVSRVQSLECVQPSRRAGTVPLQTKNLMKKKAFSLIELLIVISILGIMAAIVLPTFQNHLQKTKEVAAKDNLRILRTAIEAYTARNNGVPPGYIGNDPSAPASPLAFKSQMTGSDGYLLEIPANPFDEKVAMYIVANIEPFPTEATGGSAWIYKPQTKEIRLDWPDTDSEGVRYFDY